MSLPFWLDEPQDPPRPALAGDAEADVAIVGGGVTGLAAAHALASRGCRVALLERGRLASGASGRNAGFLLAGLASTYSVAVKSHGRERARLLWTVSRENHDLLRGLVEAESIDCLYARRGSYTLALSEQEAKSLSRSARMLAEDGFEGEFLDDTRVTRLFPGGGFLAGLFNPADGEIHPARFLRGLARAAERRGARIFEESPVSALEPGVLSTATGRLRAGRVLLATNAYTGLLVPSFADAIVGIRGQMLATEPCPERLLPAPVYADFGFEYFRQLPDGRLLAGGGRRAALDAERGFEERPSEVVQQAIEDFLHSCFPQSRGLRVTHRWAGIMGFSADELPNVGPLPGHPGVFLAGGYHGHGMGYAVAAAKAVTELMLEGKRPPICDLLDPARHA